MSVQSGDPGRAAGRGEANPRCAAARGLPPPPPWSVPAGRGSACAARGGGGGRTLGARRRKARKWRRRVSGAGGGRAGPGPPRGLPGRERLKPNPRPPGRAEAGAGAGGAAGGAGPGRGPVTAGRSPGPRAERSGFSRLGRGFPGPHPARVSPAPLSRDPPVPPGDRSAQIGLPLYLLKDYLH